MLKTAGRANPKWGALTRKCMRLREEVTLDVSCNKMTLRYLVGDTFVDAKHAATVATMPALIQTRPF
jgi:hypothetical protein